MKRTLISVISVVLILLCADIVFSAENLSVKEVLSHADRARGNIAGVEWTVKVTNYKEGSTLSRELLIKAKNDDVLARFINPPKIRNQIILMRDRNMWFIRPGLSKPVSISPRQRLIGQASNGDIASINYVADYSSTFLAEDTLNGESCYVLDLKATNRHVTYDKIKYWVSKARLVGVKAEYYTVSGKLFKIAEFKYENKIKLADKTTIAFVSELIIKNAIQQEEVTVLKYSKIRVTDIPPSTFNINLLLQ